MSEIGSERSQFDTASRSDAGTEEEEIDIEDIENSAKNYNEITSISKDKDMCLLVRICLENISNKVLYDLHLRFFVIKIRKFNVYFHFSRLIHLYDFNL